MPPIPDWFEQGITTEIAGVILVAILSLYLSKKFPFWKRWVMRFLRTTFVLFGILVLIQVLKSPLIREGDPTTVENVEERAKSWLDAFSIAHKNEPMDEAFFRIVVTMNNGNKIVLGRAKQQPQYLELACLLLPNPAEMKMLNALGKERSTNLVRELMIEASRSKIGYTAVFDPISMRLNKRIAITADLNEKTLIEALDDMDLTMTLLQQTVTKAVVSGSP